MVVSKCPCSTFTNAMFRQMPRSHWFLSINSQYLQPYWLLQQTSQHKKPQSHKATKIHTLTPLTYELFFQNSSIKYSHTLSKFSRIIMRSRQRILRSPMLNANPASNYRQCELDNPHQRGLISMVTIWDFFHTFKCKSGKKNKQKKHETILP